jgi:hypothetical protein
VWDMTHDRLVASSVHVDVHERGALATVKL